MAADQTQHCQPRNIGCPIAIKRRIPHCKASGNRVAGPLPYGVSLRKNFRVKIQLVHSNSLSAPMSWWPFLISFNCLHTYYFSNLTFGNFGIQGGAMEFWQAIIWSFSAQLLSVLGFRAHTVPKLIGIQSYDNSRAGKPLRLLCIALLMLPYILLQGTGKTIKNKPDDLDLNLLVQYCVFISRLCHVSESLKFSASGQGGSDHIVDDLTISRLLIPCL
jgi:hypothetical protein